MAEIPAPALAGQEQKGMFRKTAGIGGFSPAVLHPAVLWVGSQAGTFLSLQLRGEVGRKTRSYEELNSPDEIIFSVL